MALPSLSRERARPSSLNLVVDHAKCTDLDVVLTKHKIVHVGDKEVILSSGDLSLRFINSLTSRARLSVDIETNGLNFSTNDIGSIQVYNGIDLINIIRPPYRNLTRLREIFANEDMVKIFHHALFDLRFLKYNFNFELNNIACTKIASKILLPNLERHSLMDLLHIYLSVNLDKSHQTSDWMREDFSEAQLRYAIGDVIYLPRLLNLLTKEARERRIYKLIKKSFEYIPTRVELDLVNVGDVFVY